MRRYQTRLSSRIAIADRFRISFLVLISFNTFHFGFASDPAILDSPTPVLQATAIEGDEEPSEAEQIADLKQSLEKSHEQLAALDKELEDPQSEYVLSEAEFRKLDSQLEALQARLEQLTTPSPDAPLPTNSASADLAISDLKLAIESAKRQRNRSKERFDLAIEDNKNLREQHATLRQKIKDDQEALDELTGVSLNMPTNDSFEVIPGDSMDKASHPSNEKNRSRSKIAYLNLDMPSNETRVGHTEESENRHQSTISSEGASTFSSEDRTSLEDDADLIAARDEALQKEQQADEAQAETQSLASRLSDLQKLVHQEQKELLVAKKRVDLFTASQHDLTEELVQRQQQNAAAEELKDLRQSIGSTNQRLIQARSEVNQINERLSDHRAELSDLQGQHIAALQESQLKRQEAIEAESKVVALRNPFTIRNMLQWCLEHGPRLLFILIGMFALSRIVSFSARRSVYLISSSGGRGSKVEKENRAKTLVGVFENAITVTIFGAGAIMVLEEIGANITVLMGGVAAIGLAVAFGAQNLIKDYFYGFVILLENQYMLHDSIRIGGIAGQVERITLRMTVIRDSNGIVHFIPNGTINSVSNETNGWARAVIEITVSNQRPIQDVLACMQAASQEMEQDPSIKKWLLEKPSEPMIERILESTTVLHQIAKTQPGKNQLVRSAWLNFLRHHLQDDFSIRIINKAA